MKFRAKFDFSDFKAGQIVTGVMILPDGSGSASDLKIAIYNRSKSADGTPGGWWVLWPAQSFEPAE